GDWNAAFGGLKRRLEKRSREGSESLSLIEMARLAEAQAERRVISKILDQTRWNRKRTAQILQISYRSLLSKMKKLHIN
ncbi:MAG: helix-turn-helix domain-containing protein, partial [Acidobacteriota bacterium]